MSVVCGTDFTETSQQAAHVAAALASRLRVPLVLTHAREEFAEFTTPGAGERPLNEVLRDRLHQEAERLSQLVGAASLNVVEKLAAGPADEVLCEQAQQAGARIVVVSSLGRRAASRWLLGSVADRTAQSAVVPVLVVRNPEPLLEWLTGRKPLRIMVGVDFTPASDAALRWVQELAPLAPCEIIAVHIAWPPEEHRRLGIGGPMDLIRLHPDVERVLHQDLADRIKQRLRVPARIEIRAGFGRPADHLVQLAQEENADLLVVGTHQRHGLSRLWPGSISRGVLHNAPMSVVTVPVATVAEAPPQPVPPVKRVLATTDLSELGNRAVAHAYSVLPAGGVVHLVHVTDSDTMLHSVHAYDPSGPRPSAQEKADHVRYLEDRLRRLIPPDAAVLGIQTEVEVISQRKVAEAVVAAAERHRADLICLGSHGRSGLAKLLLGSVAQGVMSMSTKPVLVVRPPRDS